MLQVGGQEFWIDNVCANPPPSFVGGDTPGVPVTLEPNFPNPFNPSTTLKYTLAQKGHIRLTIHDVRGHLVSNLVAGVRSAGAHSAVWDGRNIGGEMVASGVYFARIQSGETVVTRKIALVQ